MNKKIAMKWAENLEAQGTLCTLYTENAETGERCIFGHLSAAVAELHPDKVVKATAKAKDVRDKIWPCKKSYDTKDVDDNTTLVSYDGVFGHGEVSRNVFNLCEVKNYTPDDTDKTVLAPHFIKGGWEKSKPIAEDHGADYIAKFVAWLRLNYEGI